MDPQAAYKMLLECSRSGDDDGEGGLAGRLEVNAELVVSIKEMARVEALGVNELCRHLWAACPADTPAKVCWISLTLNFTFIHVGLQVLQAVCPEWKA